MAHTLHPGLNWWLKEHDRFCRSVSSHFARIDAATARIDEVLGAYRSSPGDVK